MKVCLVTNTDTRCGNAEYGRNLLVQLRKEFEVDVWQACPDNADYQLVLINWCDLVVGISLEQLHRLKSFGTKIIFLIQNSYTHQHIVESWDPCAIVDAVVAHEQMNIIVKGGTCNFRLIPHGIPECKLADEIIMAVGTAGFAFPTKRIDITVKAASKFDVRGVVIAPAHPTCDAVPMYVDWLRTHSNLDLCNAWLSQEEVIYRLSQCAVNVYCSDETATPGQSGAVRMLLAARRPTIVRRCHKTETLYQYHDELYFVNNEAEAYDAVGEVLRKISNNEPVKRPERVMQEQGWNHVGEMFCSLIKELVSG